MNKTVNLTIDGLGIALFSAKTMDYVEPGSDFFTNEFEAPQQIAEHIRKGDITAFCTGTGGDFCLHFLTGQPTADVMEQFPISARLGLDVQGGSVQFCDIYWTSRWTTNFPQDQVIPLEDGFYSITVCTRMPESGYWGDNQTIFIYFEKVDKIPELTWRGVPYLCTDE